MRKLPPATVLVVEPDGTRREREYWNPAHVRGEERPAEEWRDALLEALRVAVRRRMVSDVPVGVLLSGGIDSSIVVALLAEMGQSDLKTFSIGFESEAGETGDEFDYSDLVARTYGTDHVRFRVPKHEIDDALEIHLGRWNGCARGRRRMAAASERSREHYDCSRTKGERHSKHLEISEAHVEGQPHASGGRAAGQFGGS